MRFHGLIYVACWLSLGSAVRAQWFPEAAVPLSAADLQRVEVQVRADLAKLKPAGRDQWGEIQSGEKSMAFVGDCFCDGRRLAVIQVDHEHAGLVLAEFRQGRWHLLTTWNVSPAWEPEGMAAEDSSYYYFQPKPTAYPFQRLDLDGDGVPELLVAYADGQLCYAVIKQNKGTSLPQLLEVFSSRKPPQARAGCLLTFTDSGRKSWWGETHYYRWEKGLPVDAATWHDDCFNPDKTYWEVTRADAPDTLRIYQAEDGGFEITRIQPSASNGQSTEEAYARVAYDWKPGMRPKTEDDLLLFETAELYLFEKLSGLPAAAFSDNANRPVAEVLPFLERLNVTVKGSAEAVQRLGPSAPRKSK